MASYEISNVVNDKFYELEMDVKDIRSKTSNLSEQLVQHDNALHHLDEGLVEMQSRQDNLDAKMLLNNKIIALYGVLTLLNMGALLIHVFVG